MRIRIKAKDNSRFTYSDQHGIEVYDTYDLENSEKVPSIILNSPAIKEKNFTKYVKIEYPNDGIWNLNGLLGAANFYEEAGKKAFLRGGKYKHPVKNWESEIVYMPAIEYVERCVEIFKEKGAKVTLKKLISSRRNYDLEQVFSPDQGQIFYPVLDYKGNSQEGLHRTVWFMDNYGEDTEIPVIVIK